MRRLLLLSALLVGVDQATKTLAQSAFPTTSIAEWRSCRAAGQDCVELLADVVIAPGWGLLYLVHEGLWLWTDAPLPAVYAAELFTVLLWLAGVAAALWYRRWYRASLPVDLAVGFFAAAVFGNLIDRLLVGGARDWLATPLAVANFADVAAWGTLLLLALELWRHPPSRRLLRVRTPDMRTWPKPAGDADPTVATRERRRGRP